MRTPALLLCATFGLAGCATGSAYDTFDANADACLDRAEVVDAMTDRNWTVDGTGTIAERDFHTDLDQRRVFDAYDADRDGYVEPNELGEWGTDLGDYQAWDLNADNRIATREFNEGIYGSWDRNQDGRLDLDEANRGFFDTWDANRDGCWDMNEYETGVGVDFAT